MITFKKIKVMYIFLKQYAYRLQAEYQLWKRQEAYLENLRQVFKDYKSRYERASAEQRNLDRQRFLPKRNNCDHLKGGRFKMRSIVGDYNVSMHTFIDGSIKVWCNLCSAVWEPDKPGWKEALNMVKHSTNRPSSSEVVLWPIDPDSKIPVHPTLGKFYNAENFVNG